MQINDMPIGKQLELARVAADVEQLELAAEVGVSRQTIWSWETHGTSINNQARYRAALDRIKRRRGKQ